jgi:hypothetical protein
MQFSRKQQKYTTFTIDHFNTVPIRIRKIPKEVDNVVTKKGELLLINLS